jgi:hypothetical protein
MLGALLAKLHSNKSASFMVERLYYQSTGQIIVSAVFGLALALLFQKACTGRKCLVITAPPEDDLLNPKLHRQDGSCYKFTPHYVECELDDKKEAGAADAH